VNRAAKGTWQNVDVDAQADEETEAGDGPFETGVTAGVASTGASPTVASTRGLQLMECAPEASRPMAVPLQVDS
jgi:hypothetical protein